MTFEADPSTWSPAMLNLLTLSRMKLAVAQSEAINRCPDCLPLIYVIPVLWYDDDIGEEIGTWATLEVHDESCPHYTGAL